MLCHDLRPRYATPLHPPFHTLARWLLADGVSLPPRKATGLLEFQIPPQVSRYASFLFSFIGRGAFYIFVGSILLDGHVLRIIAGSIVGLIGVCYAVLEFIPSIEPPANMREADAGWGAEQV